MIKSILFIIISSLIGGYIYYGNINFILTNSYGLFIIVGIAIQYFLWKKNPILALGAFTLLFLGSVEVIKDGNKNEKLVPKKSVDLNDEIMNYIKQCPCFKIVKEDGIYTHKATKGNYYSHTVCLNENINRYPPNEVCKSLKNGNSITIIIKEVFGVIYSPTTEK